MIYKSYKDGISLSRLGMGAMRLPSKFFGTKIEKEKAFNIIDMAMANGITYYDTAYVYHAGNSESFLGEALQKYDRKSYYLATKYMILAGKDYKKIFETQLKKLKTDYIDFYLIHCVTDGLAPKYIKSGCIDYFLEQKKAGRIKYLGFSSHASPETLDMFSDLADWDFAQIQLNYFDWYYSKTRKEYEILSRKNIPIMVMEPCRGGKLAKLNDKAEAILKKAHPDWSIPSWAFRFVKSLPAVQTVLSGMNTPEQMEDNVKTFSDEEPLSNEDKLVLKEACAAYKKDITVPCTGCGYCLKTCPKQINIPEYMKIYNDYRATGPEALKGLLSVEGNGKPTDCIVCNACKKHCPQNIGIPEILAEIKNLNRE